MQRWRVPLGFVFSVVFIIFARPTKPTLLIGLPVALLGLAIRAWASGHLRKNEQLAITGPYSYTRNPLYFGSFFLGIGFTMAAGRWWLGLLFAALYLGIYLPVMRVEAVTMLELFGDDYRAYAERVPLFFPRLTPYRINGRSKAKFDSSLYLRYREYRAAFGLVIIWALLVIKAILLK
jgi:protein-S-isoprenylcysteine O-methyltransferase Ste14